MNIWNGIDAYPEDRLAAVATIGNYDGVHLGHRTRSCATSPRAHERADAPPC